MNKLIGYEEEVLSKLLPITSDVSIGGSAVRNRYFRVPYDILDVYINMRKIPNPAEWKDYVLPELFDFGEDNYYSVFKGSSFTDNLDQSPYFTGDPWETKMYADQNPLKKILKKHVKVMDYVSFMYKNKRVKLILVSGSPQHYLAKYPRLNIRKCFYFKDKYYYSQDFKEAANSKILLSLDPIENWDDRRYMEALNILHQLGCSESPFKLGTEIVNWKKKVQSGKVRMRKVKKHMSEYNPGDAASSATITSTNFEASLAGLSNAAATTSYHIVTSQQNFYTGNQAAQAPQQPNLAIGIQPMPLQAQVHPEYVLGNGGELTIENQVITGTPSSEEVESNWVPAPQLGAGVEIDTNANIPVEDTSEEDAIAHSLASENDN